MKRRDLKKLALLGLTSGILLSTQGQAHVTDFSSNARTTLASGHGCGGGSCGSRRAQQSCGARQTAMRDSPNIDRIQRDQDTFGGTQTTSPVQRYPSNSPITAEKLRDQLNAVTKKIYDSLPENGKEQVLQAVNQNPNRDKNDVVRAVRDKLSQDIGSFKDNQKGSYDTQNSYKSSSDLRNYPQK